MAVTVGFKGSVGIFTITSLARTTPGGFGANRVPAG